MEVFVFLTGVLLSQASTQWDEERVARRAVQVSASVAAAEASVEEARAEVEGAGLALVPEVQVQMSYTRLDGFEDGGFAGPGSEVTTITIPRNRWSVEVGVSYGLIGTLLGKLRVLDSLESRVEAETLTRRTEELDVRREAKLRFHGCLGAVETASVAEASLQLARAQLERVRAQRTAGTVTDADLAGAEARVSARFAERADAQAQRSLAEARLRTYLNLPGLRLAPPPSWLRVVELPLLRRDPSELVARAKWNRPEIRVLRFLEMAQAARQDALLAELVPELSLRASYLQANPNPNVIPPREDWDDAWTAGGQISWSLERALAATAQRRGIAAERRRTEALAADLERVIEEQVLAAFFELRAARAVFEAEGARVRAARRSYEARRAAFDVGRATLDELLGADLELARARLQRVGAAVRYHSARVQLERALAS